jgi:Mor family transcriptional regulator
MTKPKADRNREIFESWQAGATQRALAGKFALSQTRICGLIREEQERRDAAQTKKTKPARRGAGCEY